MRHLYYSNSERLDIGKFREDAAKRVRGDKFNPPESCTIHFHSAEVPCEGKNHEVHNV